MMTAKHDKFPRGYYPNKFETACELEGSGSSGRIDADIAASEDSMAPVRKCINLNSDKQDTLVVPTQVLFLSHMSSSERRDLRHRLRMELEQIQGLQKKVELQKMNGITLSSSSDILSCSNGTNGMEAMRKSSVMTSGPGKKVNPIGKARGWNRGSSGRFESTKQALIPNTTNLMLMNQCEMLLKRLMSHKFGWVFNAPVDVVKLNIPDYFTIIKHPMDLGTIKGKIGSGSYTSPLEFLADVRLTFKNAMEYNPPGHDVHTMADNISKFFEMRWKTIEKKLLKTDSQALPEKSGLHDDFNTAETSPAKKRKIISLHQETAQKPLKRVMAVKDRHNLSRELESLLGEMPAHIIEFLREHRSTEMDAGEDEFEIDIDNLSDDTLFKLRKLLDDYLLEKQKNLANGEPCEIELLNESGLSNSTMQEDKGNDPADEDVDIGSNEPPVSNYPPIEIKKDTGHKSNKHIISGGSSGSDSGRSESESNDAKASSPINASMVPETFDSGAQLDDKTSAGDPQERNFSVSGLDQLEQTSRQKPSSVDSDCHQDGDSAPNERHVSPEKKYRHAILKNRFADLILKAREKTLPQDEKRDPEKLQREREELELQKKKEKARLQAEAKAAEEARRRNEAAAAAEARKKRELEREAARQALLKMEKTVEINENSRFLKDLEMLRSAPAEHLPSSVDETSPDHSQDGFAGGFKLVGSNPLEQLGLFMKEEEEEDEGEPLNDVPIPVNDVEEGEID